MEHDSAPFLHPPTHPSNRAATCPSSRPSVPSDLQTQSLAYRINISTKTTHSHLNRLITSRLALALPPFSPDPSTYAIGIQHIAPIYQTFEGLWKDLIEPSRIPAANFSKGSQDEGEIAAGTGETIAEDVVTRKIEMNNTTGRDVEIRKLLQDLYMPGLLRSERLEDDIRHLLGDIQSPFSVQRQDGVDAPERFTSHIRQAVQAKPHVLVAYSWVLYMALFAGGRYLRAQLQTAGAEFWGRADYETAGEDGGNGKEKSIRNAVKQTRTARATDHISPSLSQHRMGFIPSLDSAAASQDIKGNTKLSTARLVHGGSGAEINKSNAEKTHAGLSFFYHPGPCDGNDLKVEFKRRIAEIDALLSMKEKEDITAEAQIIFSFMVERVGDLDLLFGTSMHEFPQNSIQDTLTPRLWERGLIGSRIKEIQALISLKQVLGIFFKIIAFIGIVELLFIARRSSRRILRLDGEYDNGNEVSVSNRS